MKILVVDDDLKVRETLHKLISRQGYECKTATNGREALEIVEEDNFSFVISDIKMPGMNGMELLKAIKKDYPDIDVIIMTAYSEDYTFTDVIKAGASDFISKPFSQDELEAKLGRIIKERKLRSDLVESRNKLMAIFDGIRDGMYSIDQDFKILSANKAFAESLGLSIEDVIGRHCYELTHKQNVPCEGDDHSCPGKECFTRGLVASAIHKHYGKEGKECYIEITAMPLIVDGKTRQAITISRDITERFLAETKLREAEKELRESKDFLEKVLGAATDGIMINDETGQIISINSTLEQISGLRKEELIGEHSSILVPKDNEHRKMIHEKIVEMLEKGSASYESFFKYPDGKHIDVEWRNSMIQDSSGNSIAGISIVRDITERKQAEEKLRETKDYLNNIIESSLDYIIVSNNQGDITRVNKSFLELLGYTQEEIIGKHITEFTPKDEGSYKSTTDELIKIDAEFFNDAQIMTARLFEDSKIFNWESYYIRKDKKVIPIEQNIACLYNEKGEVTGAVGIVRDITRRKKMEESLKRRIKELYVLNYISGELTSSLNLNSILSNILQKILDVTSIEIECGAILLLNEKDDALVLKTSIGFESEALKKGAKIALGKGVSSRAVQSKKPVLVEDLKKCEIPGVEILREEKIKNYLSIPVAYREKILGTINLASHIQYHFTSEEINLLTLIANQIGLAINNARLFEETKNALEELKKTQSYLLQSEKMASIGQLAAGVAHEINNPMGFIHSNLGSLNKYSNKVLELFTRYEEGMNLLKNNGSDGIVSYSNEMEELKKKLKMDFIMKDFQKVIAESLEGTERIKKIVADLKSFSRVDHAEFKHTNINEGIESTLNVVWNELKYKCSVEKDYGKLPQVYCNMGQLNQVFMNLLINAAQAIKDKGTIKIATHYVNGQSGAEQGYIEIKISDTGRGIPEDKLNKIFEPFFTTKAVGKGTGLGLSIAYDIIQKHKGEISVESAVGKGTTFTIQLPMMEAENKEHGA